MAQKAKPRRARLEVLPDIEGGWSVTCSGMVIGTCDRRADAVAMAADTGRKLWSEGTRAQLFIKGRDGKIQDERTYGEDPRATPG